MTNPRAVRLSQRIEALNRAEDIPEFKIDDVGSSEQPHSSLLDGEFSEQESHEAFLAALNEWRGVKTEPSQQQVIKHEIGIQNETAEAKVQTPEITFNFSKPQPNSYFMYLLQQNQNKN